jgi:tetratricopeptide (TPR) repeat protein
MNLLPLSLLSPKRLLRVARKNNARGDNGHAILAVNTALEKLAQKSSSILGASFEREAGEAWLLKGRVHKELGQNDSATVAFLSAYELRATDVDALDFLTSELLKSGDQSEVARSVYLDYLSEVHHSERHEQTKRNLQLLESLSAPDWGRPETIDSTEKWNELIASRRNDLPWVFRHVGTIAMYFGDWWRAVSYLEQALLRDGNDCDTRQQLAYALFKEDRLDEAKEHLDHLVARQPRGASRLLRAHVHRAIGDPAAAALDYRWVAESKLLIDEERLSYAEVCINAGYFEEAARQLNLIGMSHDPRWLLLSGIVDRCEQREGEALIKFARLVSHDQFCPQAVAQILSLLAARAGVPQGLEVLEYLPEYYRDDLYWSVKGNVLLSLGRLEGALDAWKQVASPAEELYETINSVGQYYFADLYARGQDLEIIRALRRDLTSGMDSDNVAEIIVSALGRYIQKNLSVTSRPKKFLRDLDLIEHSFPGYPGLEKLDLLRALVHTSAGDYYKAAVAFSRFAPALTGNDEMALQVARCAIHLGSSADCLEALEYLDSEDQRANKIRCALAALDGDWDTAAKYVSALQPASNYHEFKAAIFFQAGRWADLESLNGASSHIATYYRMAHLLLSGKANSAFQVQSSIPADESTRNLSNWLFGWLRLQVAKDLRSEGNLVHADENLVDALILWPESSGPASCLKSLDAHLMSTLLLNEKAMEAFGGLLEAHAARRSPADAASCHNLGLFHFCNGVRHANRGAFDLAIESWEKSIGYISVALCDQTYMTDWARRRLMCYGTYQVVESAQIERDVLQYCDATFKKWSEELANRSMSAEAAKVLDLPLAMRAELQAARVLSTLGGFSVTPNSVDKISAGPIFISMMKYERPFASFLSQLRLKHADLPDSLPENPADALAELFARWEAEEREGAVDPLVKERLEKLCSVMRIASVREEEDNLESALRRLREAKSTLRSKPQGRARNESVFQPAFRTENLSKRNPAFARKGGAKQLRELAARYEVELLVALGAQNVASSDDRISIGIQNWSESITLSAETGQYLWVVDKIRETARGRAYVLKNKNQFEDAIKLLEGVDELCGDDDVRSLLAKLHAIEGVLAGNSGEMDRAVTKLRQATLLNSQSIYAQENLAGALLYRVEEVRFTDPNLARMMLEEALTAIDICRSLDEHNEEYKKTHEVIKAKWNFMRIELGEITMNDLPPEDVVGLILLAVE